MEKGEFLTKALGKLKNRYMLVNVLSKRLRQLKDEFSGGSDLDSRAALDMALKEIAEDKLITELPEDDKKEKQETVAE